LVVASHIGRKKQRKTGKAVGGFRSAGGRGGPGVGFNKEERIVKEEGFLIICQMLAGQCWRAVLAGGVGRAVYQVLASMKKEEEKGTSDKNLKDEASFYSLVVNGLLSRQWAFLAMSNMY
jgi:hypothetical protein